MNERNFRLPHRITLLSIAISDAALQLYCKQLNGLCSNVVLCALNTIQYNAIQCNTIQPIFDICQAQKCTFTPRRRRCNCNVVHCGRGTAQGPYVTARAGFEPATLRMKGDESTNELPRQTKSYVNSFTILYNSL